MNRRLAQFMEAEALSSAKLAEILSVQPSNISHLLTGRNKPNFDFISRLLSLFPNLSARWLINGEGGMYNVLPPQSFPNDLFAKGSNVEEGESYKCNNKESGNDINLVINHENQAVSEITNVTTANFVEVQNSAKNGIFAHNATNSDNKESIENSASQNSLRATSGTEKARICDSQPLKLFVLYADNTFEWFDKR